MLEKLRWSLGPFASEITDLLAWTKHFLWKVGLVVPALVLVSACSRGAQATTPSSAISIGDNGALPVESQLIAGSLLLEETDVAIDKDQAGELLLLWKAFRSLSNSDTSAQAELDAVISQVEDTMSTEQLQVIAAMQLTTDDLTSVLRQHATQSMSASADASGVSDGVGPVASFAAGAGPGPGGGDGNALLAPSAGQGAILSAASSDVPTQNPTTTDRSGDRAAIRLVDSLIALLETKADA